MRTFIFICVLLCTQLCFAAKQSDLDKLKNLKSTENAALDLSNADLRGYMLGSDKIDLRNANLSHTNLANVNITKLNLSGANLSGANLSGAKLNQANLTNANLTHANLSLSLIHI